MPSSVILVIHTFRDLELLAQTRQRLKQMPPGKHQFEIKALEKEHLLQSMYAETLRFGVQIHIPRCAPHHNVKLGSSSIPNGKLILINTSVAHNDESIWNTEGMKFPLQMFWAGRFLTCSWNDCTQDNSSNRRRGENDQRGTENFSVQGLEGSWIPFGGEMPAPLD